MSRRDRPIEERSYRWHFFVLALLTAASVAWAVWDETTTRRPWKRYQNQFNAARHARGLAPRPIALIQVSNPELGVVDRCQSCHLAIDEPGFDSDDLPPLLRSHSRREVIFAGNHPADEVGCTICHRGQGAQTKGVRGQPFDHGRNDPFWDQPMLSPGFAESTCVTCHIDEDPSPGAELFNRGRRLYEDLRCFACHESALVRPGFAVAPPFDHLRAKASASLVTSWLDDPRTLRPDTRMPWFWPDPDDELRDQEIAAITAFLATIEPGTLPAPSATDGAEPVARGKQLFAQIGCQACHAIDLPATEVRTIAEPFAPNLAHIGEMATAQWLRAWLSQTGKMWPQSSMPDLRLTRAEVDALVDYLVGLRRTGTEAMASTWPAGEAALVAAGKTAVGKYRCYGCHDMPGFEAAGKAGVELAGYGDKTSDLLAWGDAAIDCDRPLLECYTVAKIATPRRFTGQGLTPVMPVVELSDEDAVALSIFALGHRQAAIPPRYQHLRSDEERVAQEGEHLLARANCRGCHEIGRVEKRIVDDDGELIEIEYTPIGARTIDLYETPSAAPPPLTFAGEKFQYPWLFEFLAAPTRLRPWLLARMPTYALDDAERTSLLRYFAHRNQQPFPFERLDRPRLAAADRAGADHLFALLQCSKCHQVSTQAGLSSGELAPDLALAGERLKSGWQRRWILDPQTLQPGTAMPTYFALEDEDDPDSLATPCPTCLGGDIDAQIDALVRLTIDFAAP